MINTKSEVRTCTECGKTKADCVVSSRDFKPICEDCLKKSNKPEHRYLKSIFSFIPNEQPTSEDGV